MAVNIPAHASMFYDSYAIKDSHVLSSCMAQIYLSSIMWRYDVFRMQEESDKLQLK